MKAVLRDFGALDVEADALVSQSADGELEIEQRISFDALALGDDDKHEIKSEIEAEYAELIDAFDSAKLFIAFGEAGNEHRRLLPMTRYLVSVRYGNIDSGANEENTKPAPVSSSPKLNIVTVASLVLGASLICGCLVFIIFRIKRQRNRQMALARMSTFNLQKIQKRDEEADEEVSQVTDDGAPAVMNMRSTAFSIESTSEVDAQIAAFYNDCMRDTVR